MGSPGEGRRLRWTVGPGNQPGLHRPPCRRPSPGDHDHCGDWVWTLRPRAAKAQCGLTRPGPQAKARAMETDAATLATPERKPESWASLARFVLLLFLGALVLRTLVVAPFSIPSSSMLPRLLVGDYLFVSKWSYGYSRYSFPFGILNFQGRLLGGVPERGDVVVFRYPGIRDEDLVKRVIGLPGDTIELRQGIVVLNGQPLPRERIADFALAVSPNSEC